MNLKGVFKTLTFVKVNHRGITTGSSNLLLTCTHTHRAVFPNGERDIKYCLICDRQILREVLVQI